MRVSEKMLVVARKRLLQMHYESGVGHIGGNLSCLDAIMLTLHEYVSLEDRFILSKGHSAGALYITLWSLDRLSDDSLKEFHKDDTLLAGHPPASGIKDILFATGTSEVRHLFPQTRHFPTPSANKFKHLRGFSG